MSLPDPSIHCLGDVFSRLAASQPIAVALLDPSLTNAELTAYRPERYRGRVDLLLTEVSKREASDPDLGWARLARGQLSSHLLPGDHSQIVKAPNVALLSAQLADRLGFPASP